MATFARVNGATEAFGAVGRQIALTSFSKTNLTQAELDAVVAYIELTATVTAIGVADSGAQFSAGSTTTVYIITEGPAVAAGSNFGGVTGVTSAAVAYFPANNIQ